MGQKAFLVTKIFSDMDYIRYVINIVLNIYLHASMSKLQRYDIQECHVPNKMNSNIRHSIFEQVQSMSKELEEIIQDTFQLQIKGHWKRVNIRAQVHVKIWVGNGGIKTKNIVLSQIPNHRQMLKAQKHEQTVPKLEPDVLN